MPRYPLINLYRLSSTFQQSTSIFALASGSRNQKTGVAVIRLSGRSSLQVLSKLTQQKPDSFRPRFMYMRDIWHPITNDKLDKSLVVWFKEPRSFTGEDVCELHVHGGPAVISSVLNALSTFPNLRYAEPGEFSKRAFLNGKMDLVEIEGLADLVNAETEYQRKQALGQMEGNLSRLYGEWRTEIIKSLANVEAFIDFSEEENVEDNVLDEVKFKVKKLIRSIEMHLNDGRKGERLRNGVRVTIIGEPNAGKSSLLNSLCKRPAAIVSPIPGTTRDIIESALNISGYPVLLSDTAGLRETTDSIEVEGVKRAMDKMHSADILILVVDVKTHFGQLVQSGLEEFLDHHLRDVLKIDLTTQKEVLVAFNKSDLLDLQQLEVFNQIGLDKCEKYGSICKISCVQDNLDELLDRLGNKLKHLCTDTVGETPTLTQERHRGMLEKCVAGLRSYLIKVDQQVDFALAAEDLRLAVRWLGHITGHVTSEDILDIIFRDFCIGK